MVSYGKIGTAGSVKTREFDTEEACQKDCEKLIQSKLKKGYVFDSSSQGVIKETAFTEEEFWEMIDKCKQRGSDIEEQMEWLTSCLSKKAVKDIVMFDYTFNQIYEKSYTSDLWAAAYIVMGGCSDDSFDYFRAWVVYLGKETYQTALENPITKQEGIKFGLVIHYDCCLIDQRNKKIINSSGVTTNPVGKLGDVPITPWETIILHTKSKPPHGGFFLFNAKKRLVLITNLKREVFESKAC